MNVLYISHTAELNGAPKSLLEFVVRIREKQIHPIILVPDRGMLKAELDKEGIDVRIVSYQGSVYSGRFSIANYTRYLKENFQAIKKIIEIIRKEKIDIVHSNSLAVNAGAIAAHLACIPHVWHFREYLKDDFGFKRFDPVLDQYLIRKSDCCIAISKDIKRVYKKKYGVDAVLMYNGMNSQLYYEPIDQKTDRTGKTNIIIAGSILQGKGQWDAIRAVEILKKEGQEVCLNIVGDGLPAFVNELKRYVKKHQMEKNILFYRYTKELQAMRSNSSMVLVCSKREAFGRVTAEAMMSGKIVIGSNRGGTRELIGANEERGYLYTWNNPKELAQKIQFAISNPSETIKREKRAQEFVLRLTDLENYTDKLERIYQKILESDVRKSGK